MDYYHYFDGIVLMRQAYREKDMLVKILTRDHGKLMFFLRNAQQSNHPLTAATQVFTRATFLGHIHQNGFSFLKDSHDIKPATIVLQDVKAQAVLAYLTQLTDAVMDDHIVNKTVFQLLWDAIEAINNGVDAEVILRFFEIKILRYYGVEVEWQHCVICNRDSDLVDFSIQKHGCLCKNHLDEDEYRMHLSRKALYVARQLALVSSPKQIGSIQLSSETTSELRRLFDTIMEEYVGIRLKSKKFLNQMVEWETLMQKRGQD